MRALERFLVVLAFLSLIMRIMGLKDAPILELISLPALALFYLAVFPFLLFSSAGIEFKGSWKFWALAFVAGIALAYCLISLLCSTLDWIDVSDMLVNGSLICSVLIGSALWLRRKKESYWKELFWRALILWLAMSEFGIWKLSVLGALSFGP